MPEPVRSRALASGEASAPKRKRRSANRSPSVRLSAAVSSNTRCTRASREVSPISRMRMLRESSSTTANTLRCGTADAITRPGRSRQPSTSSTAKVRSPARTMRSRGEMVRTRAYRNATSRTDAAAATAMNITGTTGANAKSPRANTRAGNLKKNVTMASTTDVTRVRRGRKGKNGKHDSALSHAQRLPRDAEVGRSVGTSRFGSGTKG